MLEQKFKIIILTAAVVLSAAPSRGLVGSPPGFWSDSEDEKLIPLGCAFREIFHAGFEQLDVFQICPHMAESLQEKLSLLKKEIDAINPQDRGRIDVFLQEIEKVQKSKDSYSLAARNAKCEAEQKLADARYKHTLRCIAQHRRELEELMSSKYPKLSQIALKALRIIDSGARVGGRDPAVAKTMVEMEKAFGIIVEYVD